MSKTDAPTESFARCNYDVACEQAMNEQVTIESWSLLVRSALPDVWALAAGPLLTISSILTCRKVSAVKYNSVWAMTA